MVGFVKSALNLFGINKKEGEGTATVNSVGLEEFLERLPEEMGVKVSFKKIERDDGALHFEVEGEERDSFVGQGSEVLDALSHIAMRVLRRSQGLSNSPLPDNAGGLRVVFDADGFRERKVGELKQMAETLRQRVVDSGGKPAYVPALGPSERKVIHTHLADLGEVVSESIGKGTFKRIRIRLKDDSPFRKPQEERADGQGQANSRGPRRGGSQRGGRGRNRSGGGRGGRNNNYGDQAQGSQDSYNRPYMTDASHQDSYNDIDENIGNRLAPGEEPIYGYNKPSSGN